MFHYYFYGVKKKREKPFRSCKALTNEPFLDQQTNKIKETTIATEVGKYINFEAYFLLLLLLLISSVDV